MKIGTMNPKDTISGQLAECFITIDNERIYFMQAETVTAKINKQKADISIMGKTCKGKKTTGWSGTGTAKFFYGFPIFRDMIKKYKDTGKDIYFDMQITNEDPTSDVGRQTIILKNCNLDGITLAQFDVNADVLEEEADFTFEDFEIPEKFARLN